MKSITMLIFLILGLSNSFCQELDCRKLRMRDSITYKDKKLYTGKCMYHYSTGEKRAELNYLEGKYHGDYIFWFSNGNKKVEGKYEHGVLEGKWTWWFSNGNKKSEGLYMNNKKTGIWKWWYKKDGVMGEKKYVKGVVVGDPIKYPKKRNKE